MKNRMGRLAPRPGKPVLSGIFLDVMLWYTLRRLTSYPVKSKNFGKTSFEGELDAF